MEKAKRLLAKLAASAMLSAMPVQATLFAQPANVAPAPQSGGEPAKLDPDSQRAASVIEDFLDDNRSAQAEDSSHVKGYSIDDLRKIEGLKNANLPNVDIQKVVDYLVYTKAIAATRDPSNPDVFRYYIPSASHS